MPGLDALASRLLNRNGIFRSSNVEDALEELAALAANPRLVDVGEFAFDPTATISGTAQTSGSVVLSAFQALRTETITQLRLETGGTAAAATPTLIRLGVYERNPLDNLWTLLASTVGTDLTLFSAANATYTKPLTAPFYKKIGRQYADAYIVVTGVAMPNFHGPSSVGGTAFGTDMQLLTPIKCGRLAGQSDLPATIPGASLVACGSPPHVLNLQ